MTFPDHRRAFRSVIAGGEGGERLFILASDYIRVMAAIAPFAERAFEAARKQGRRERPEAYAFDGLVALARASSTITRRPTRAGLWCTDEASGRSSRPTPPAILANALKRPK